MADRFSQVLAVITVTDLDHATEWYTRLFGRPPDRQLTKTEAEWLLTSGGSVQLALDEDRAGFAMVTLGVPDLAALIADLGTRGLEVRPANGDPSRLAQIEDHDGNKLTFAQRR